MGVYQRMHEAVDNLQEEQAGAVMLGALRNLSIVGACTCRLNRQCFGTGLTCLAMPIHPSRSRRLLLFVLTVAHPAGTQ